jgi:hypothetical protein
LQQYSDAKVTVQLESNKPAISKSFSVKKTLRQSSTHRPLRGQPYSKEYQKISRHQRLAAGAGTTGGGERSDPLVKNGSAPAAVAIDCRETARPATDRPSGAGETIFATRGGDEMRRAFSPRRAGVRS